MYFFHLLLKKYRAMKKWCYFCTMNNMRILAFIFALVAAAVSGCTDHRPFDEPVASVGDATLTKSRLCAAIPSEISGKDSIAFAQDVVRQWVMQQVVVQKAVDNLSDEELDIDAAIEDYRNSLITELYRQKIVDQKFKPSVGDDAINEYYEKMKDNFRIEEAMMKGIFVILPKKAPDLDNMKKCISKHNDADMFKIEQYIYKHAVKYEMAVDQWIDVKSIRQQFPKKTIANEKTALSSGKLYTTTDDSYTYLLIAFDYLADDDYAPVEFVKDKITSILLNKQKLKFIKDFEQSLYNQALKSDKIHYYDK